MATSNAEIERNRDYLRDLFAVAKNVKLSELLAGDAWASAPRVWIVGGGPSLRGFNWELLRGEVVIGTNRAYEIPQVGLALTCDAPFARRILNRCYGADALKKWNEFPGPRVFTVLPNSPMSRNCDEPFYVVDRHASDPVYPPTLNGLGWGNNSGWMGLQLAWALGAKQINLLGFDMKGDGSGKQAWWHSGHTRVQEDECYERFKQPFCDAAPHLRASGVHVTNFCLESGLECFQRAGQTMLEKVLGEKPERPLVIGYYTAGTSYEKEIRGMVQTARVHGLEFYLEAIPSLGGWTKNTYYKAVFIERMLERFPGRSLLFLDADSRIRRYPVLLDNFDADLGACVFEWGKLGKRKPDEMSTAVIYLRSTPAVRGVIRDWVHLNHELPMAPMCDQRNFQRVVERASNLNFKRLPMTYCQIFDLMSGVGAPVIEQMQASRRFKQEVGA